MVNLMNDIIFREQELSTILTIDIIFFSKSQQTLFLLSIIKQQVKTSMCFVYKW